MTRHETMQPWQKAIEAFIESMQESIKEICYFQGRNTQDIYVNRRISYAEKDNTNSLCQLTTVDFKLSKRLEPNLDRV